jgi:shikimate dehydrogenase
VSVAGLFRVGVIGDPVAHSLSPAIHQPALDALGIRASYERWHTSGDDLPARIASLRSPETLGASVTVPHKVAVMPLLDEIARSASDAGAVNTIINREGRLVGENTDVYGFAASLAETWGNGTFGTNAALVLGAGGAARAVVLGLHGLGVRDITVVNRGQRRVRKLAADLRSVPVAIGDPEPDALAEALRRTSVLVNATSLGWKQGETPLSLDLVGNLPTRAIVVDLTYRDTDLLVAARADGYRTLDGLAMLVHQGAKALEMWTGKTSPLAVMREAALRARAGRA